MEKPPWFDMLKIIIAYPIGKSKAYRRFQKIFFHFFLPYIIIIEEILKLLR